jgi:hypothetical protein
MDLMMSRANGIGAVVGAPPFAGPFPERREPIHGASERDALSRSEAPWMDLRRSRSDVLASQTAHRLQLLTFLSELTHRT